VRIPPLKADLPPQRTCLRSEMPEPSGGFNVKLGCGRLKHRILHFDIIAKICHQLPGPQHGDRRLSWDEAPGTVAITDERERARLAILFAKARMGWRETSVDEDRDKPAGPML